MLNRSLTSRTSHFRSHHNKERILFHFSLLLRVALTGKFLLPGALVFTTLNSPDYSTKQRPVNTKRAVYVKVCSSRVRMFRSFNIVITGNEVKKRKDGPKQSLMGNDPLLPKRRSLK